LINIKYEKQKVSYGALVTHSNLNQPKEIIMPRQPLAIREGQTHSPFQMVWWKPFLSTQKECSRTIADIFSGTPLEEFMSVQEGLFEKLEDTVSNVFGESFNTRQMLTPWAIGDHTDPYIDIIENKSSFKIKAELPGVKEQDITLSLVDGGLQIEGEKYEECAEKGENYRHQECHAGYFCRTIALPEEADMDKAKVRFNLNVLSVDIPKKNENAAKPGLKLSLSMKEKHSEKSKAPATTFKKPLSKTISIKDKTDEKASTPQTSEKIMSAKDDKKGTEKEVA
jgi:HSP20 family protein